MKPEIFVSNTTHSQEGSKKGRMGEKTLRRRKCTKLERNKRKSIIGKEG
jgi:hypothetical protein